MRIDEAARAIVNRPQLFDDGQAIGARLIRTELDELLEAGDDPAAIVASWAGAEAAWRRLRAPYLLYP